MAKKKSALRAPILPHWHASGDVLLKALVANGGDLVAAVKAASGQMAVGKDGPESLHLWRSRVGDEGMEAFAGFTGVTAFESGERMTDAALFRLRAMTRMERITLI